MPSPGKPVDFTANRRKLQEAEDALRQVSHQLTGFCLRHNAAMYEGLLAFVNAEEAGEFDNLIFKARNYRMAITRLLPAAMDEALCEPLPDPSEHRGSRA